MTSQRTILVCGATGKQGGSVVDALLRYSKYKVRIISRDISKNSVKFLKNRGVEVYKGDYSDKKSVQKAIKGCYGVFMVTNFWETCNAKDEIKHGIILTNAMKKYKIEHCVWSCLEDTRDVLGDAVKNIGEFKVPHFDGKSIISQYMKTEKIPVTYLYTSFYWENFLDIMKPVKNDENEYEITIPMENKKLGGVCIDDIGKMAANIFLKGKELIGKDIGVVGEYLTINEITDTLTKYSGKKYVYKPLSNKEYRELVFPGADDLANMFIYYTKYEEEFEKYRNINDVKKMIDITTFDKWANKYFNKTQLAFYNKPGNVEPIRILLRKANVSFYDNRFRNNHDYEENSRSNDDIHVFQQRFEIPFNYIPVLKDDDLLITNTFPILRYISKKYNFNGINDFENTKLDSICTATDNLLTKFFKMLMSPNDNDHYQFKNHDLPLILTHYDKILNENKKRFDLDKPIYFSGTRITYGDVVIYNFVKTLISTLKNLRFPESIVIFYRHFDENLNN